MTVSKEVMFVSTAPVEVNGMEDDDDDEVMLEEENMGADPQIELKGAEEEVRVEEADVSPGPSRPAGTPQAPDEEQAGKELLFFYH